MSDVGDKNVFTLYKGKYEATPGEGVTMENTAVMLTQMNEVAFMGNCNVRNYVEDETILDLPEECCPPLMFTIPVYHQDNSGLHSIVPLNIYPNGDVACPVALADGTLYTGGRSFNIGGKWYDTVGGENNG